MQFASFESLQKLVFPDQWQALAVQSLNAGNDVVVSAPTGAGKTYIFERWAAQGNFSKRALFTVPTRALANDKYAEWRSKGWRVGIITGDVTLAPDAPVVVATLEAVQGIVANPAAGDTPFQILVIDEYQWLSDDARGNHYEGVLLSIPSSLQLLLLSGSVSNPGDVAAWLRRLGRKVEVVQTRERPVPLDEVEVDDLIGGLPQTIQGFWSRRVAGALRAGYGPILVFAPHRQDAERLARQFARELPLSDPISLSKEQELACGPELARLLRARVAYHHSGLSYLQRAGVIEPLAKGGQLRVVVATLGLSAGINFSLRSVLITAAAYRFDHLERELEPHDLLQMIGRAGRRGLDEAGFVLISSSTPRLRSAAPLRLKRANPLPWAFLLRALRSGLPAAEMSRWAGPRFFSEQPLAMGDEQSSMGDSGSRPCGQTTDTGRARLVRRHKRPFSGCKNCALREECLSFSSSPTPLWQWQKLGLLDRNLQLTPRGELVSFFLGPEGLALAAALSDKRYPIDDLVFECANLFAGERFSGTNPRRLGRLASVCERCYRAFQAEGYLDRGVPPQYGFGASDFLRSMVEEGEKARKLLEAHEVAGRGDLDRLLTEWRSLLRQIAGAPALLSAQASCPEDLILLSRWQGFQERCRAQLGDTRWSTLPELPVLSPEQRRPVSHRFFSASLRAPRAPSEATAPRQKAC